MPSSPVRANGRRTRARLIDVGRSLFSQSGYSKVTVEDIVRQAGVTQGSFYHHFASKKELFRAVFGQVEHDWKADTIGPSTTGAEVWASFRRRRGRPGQDSWDVYSEGVLNFVEHARSRAEERVILYTEGPAVLGWMEWRSLRDRAFGLEFHAAAVQAAVDEGILAPHNPRVLGSLLFAMLEECAVLAADNPPARAAHDINEELLAVLNGIRAPRA